MPSYFPEAELRQQYRETSLFLRFIHARTENLQATVDYYHTSANPHSVGNVYNVHAVLRESSHLVNVGASGPGVNMGASESKLAFKQNVFSLAGSEDFDPQDQWWAQFYTLPESAEDIFSLWSPNDLRSLTSTNSDESSPPQTQVEPKKNFETLIYTVIGRLQVLQTNHVHPDSQASTSTEILNCMRILTRLMPYIFEAEHLKAWQERFFWQPRKPTFILNKKNKPSKLFDGLQPSKEFAIQDQDRVLGPPLGETLLDLAVKYLFFAGFTIPRRLDENNRPDLEPVVKVWQTGIGSSKSLNCTKENEKNQMETIRLLLTLTSKTMYISANSVATSNIESLTYLTTRLESRSVNGIVCSLLNTVLKYNPNAWNLPIDLAAGSNDPKKMLVIYSIQLLLVLAVYVAPVNIGDGKNQFRQSLGMLHRADDFQFIQQGLSQVLSQPVSGSFNVFQSRERAVPWAPEMLSLLWEMLQCNRRFRRYIIETGCGLDYVILVLYYAMDAKDGPSKQGTLRLCVFILQTLSADSTFATKLNMSFSHAETLPPIMRVQNFHGSYTDFLLCSIHSIITTANGKWLESLYPALLAVINNLAPYQKGLARATSSKLMDLYTLLSSPAFLLANESNHNLLHALLDAFNVILERRYQENRRFVEVLAANRKRFKALQDFSIDGALAEVNRQAQERKDYGTETCNSRPASIDSIRGPPPLARSPSLGTVAEDSRFEIGDDEDDDEDNSHSSAAQSHVGGASSISARLSEKARGKRPALLPSSRNPSTASLATLASITNANTTPFVPSLEWLESWYPYLPLENITQTIRRETSRQSFSDNLSDADNFRPDSQEVTRNQAEQTATLGENGTQTTVSGRQGGQETRPHPANTFTWTPGALGWYSALIWGRIYLQEAEAFQGAGGLYNGTNIVLFRRSATSHEISLRSPKGAIDAVGDSLARRISSISIKSQ